MKKILGDWKEAHRRLARPDKVLWLFDFDGTLAPIARRPAAASMPPVVRGLLRRLVRRFPRNVGIVSGRPVNQLIRKTGIPGLMYVGTHGFDIKGPAIRWRRAVPAARLKSLNQLYFELKRLVREIPGLQIEDKRWALTVHYREIRLRDQPRAAAVILYIRNLAAWSGFKVQEGLKAFEILSDASWNKGHAVRLLKKSRHLSRVFYAGDDVTDEAVFRILKRADVSVHVGEGLSCAEYVLRNQKDITSLLGRILAL